MPPCGHHANTLRAYLREFLAGGVDAMKEFRRSNSQGALDGHRTTLEAYFRERPPATVNEAAAKIEEFTGIQRSETQVRKFLKIVWHAPAESRLRTGQSRPGGTGTL